MQENYQEVLLADLTLEQVLIKTYLPDQPGNWSGIHWYGNTTTMPSDAPPCGWQQELCIQEESTHRTLLAVLAAVGIFVVGIMIILLIVMIKVYRHKAGKKEMNGVIIKWDHLEKVSVEHKGDDTGINKNNRVFEIVNLKGKLLVVKRLSDNIVDLTDKKVLLDLRTMIGVSHDNLNHFVGICNEPINVCILMMYEPRGNLQNIIADKDFGLSSNFKVSFMLDVACGMWYIHQSPLGFHGSLTSARCIVDSRWVCKLTGHGLKHIKETYGHKHQPSTPAQLLWTAPELLQSRYEKLVSITDQKRADVYSFAIITQEVFLEDVPYGKNEPISGADEIIQYLCTPDSSYRPYIPANTCPKEWITLMEVCWQPDPARRPSFLEVLREINSIHRYKNMSLVDNMAKHLEKHTQHLEDTVAERAKELEGDRSKMNSLLCELLPQSVVRELSAGKQVMPETFDCVTLFISTIVGFAKISSKSSPMEIVKMLNQMYILFDELAQKYDVYKVATIGDAYVVASGVPMRNGDMHAVEICHMGLAISHAITQVGIHHTPEDHVQLRMGIHSGPCVAGVIGLKMPRYLLFGETISIAEEIECGGEAMKLHISHDTAEFIKNEHAFVVVKRGEFYLNGKGSMFTYWLT